MRTLCLILIFLGIMIFGIEIANDFSKTKVFYASFNPQRYFYKDDLEVEEKIPPMSSNSNKTHWLFYGICTSDKLKSSVAISMNIIEDRNFNINKIPIWRISIIKDEVIYRRQNNILNSPFSYEMRNYWITPLLILSVIPALFYYLAILKSGRKANKKTS
ncbi:hypothetical protein ACFFLS_08510 [Flavobacterium procerum]|uniref:DUF3592 domain-containing protein n=1 Tax=Flavobacterium procerum TaxID=1455569 RepID=A0ABV6BNQ3_9FLAO